jgi:hypothetical protein
MTKETNDFYIKLHKKFEKYDKSLRKFCDSRKPKLNYNRVRQRFLRLKKEVEISDNRKPVANTPKEKKAPSLTFVKGKGKKIASKLKGQPSTDTPKSKEKKGKPLSPRQQKLLEIELSSTGMTKGQMAEAAGFTAKNKSKAFIQATQTFDYQAVLSKSRAELQAKIGISREAILTRYFEIGFSRIRDVAVLEKGVLKLRSDVDFDKDGADLAIKGFTIKTKDVTTDDRTETQKEYKIELADNLKALNDAVKIGGYFDDSVFNSVVDGNKEMLELWDQFQLQEITANDLSMQLAMQGLAVPPAIQLQAKAELVAIAKGGGDDDVSLIDMMDSYDEMLEDSEIAKKKAAVEAERKKELEIREIELEALNRKDDNEKG